MRAIARTCALLLLAGCRQLLFPPTPAEIEAEKKLKEHGPIGQQTAECRRPASCYSEAQEVCPHGYDKIDSAQDVLPGGGYVPPHMRLTLIYECRHPELASGGASSQ